MLLDLLSSQLKQSRINTTCCRNRFISDIKSTHRLIPVPEEIHTSKTTSRATIDQGRITWIHCEASTDEQTLFLSSLQPIQSECRRNLQDDEWWKHRPIASIIQKSMCEQLFPGSLDRDHTETDDTMIDVISPLHAFCEDQGSLQYLGRI